MEALKKLAAVRTVADVGDEAGEDVMEAIREGK